MVSLEYSSLAIACSYFRFYGYHINCSAVIRINAVVSVTSRLITINAKRKESSFHLIWFCDPKKLLQFILQIGVQRNIAYKKNILFTRR
jgi:hypothetical protein